jgi:hypothetical protein
MVLVKFTRRTAREVKTAKRLGRVEAFLEASNHPVADITKCGVMHMIAGVKAGGRKWYGEQWKHPMPRSATRYSPHVQTMNQIHNVFISCDISNIELISLTIDD